MQQKLRETDELVQQFRMVADSKLQHLRNLNRPLRIGMDIDGTLAHFHDVFIQVYNGIHGTNFTKKDITNYDFGKVKMSPGEFPVLHEHVWSTESEAILPAADPVLLKEEVSENKVDILTYRPIEQQPAVQHWLERNYSEIKFDIVIVRKTEDKLYLGYDILHDDASPLAEEILKSNETVSTQLLLVNQPWNMKTKYEQLSEKITRVPDINAGIRIVLNLKRN
ncbi:MAG: hypothetical protein ABSD68_00220 [Candidatus Micrarchaeales archaeon]